MAEFRILRGLPASGPKAIAVPSGWGHDAREGLIVEFELSPDTSWVGNFCPGLGGLDDVRRHPNGHSILVTSQGRMFEVDPVARTAVQVAEPIFAVWTVIGANDLILSRQDIALLRIGAEGVVWHTRRVSWDGFRHIRIESLTLSGEAWSPMDNCWHHFSVDLRTGRAEGGSYTGPEEKGWEQLAGGCWG